ncbi:uncharacterized protein LOC134233388 [Saccostrea cucullata]|uniref:uncharacterized protein LOC134233388 n=1 Tax=Saccostrea cuccullata TaxID=36930 RepID=UPI002ED6AEC7
MKPLLSVPGNNSNIFEVWETDTAGKFNGIFLDDIMRNPAIDWWNEGRLYHTPEYVTLFTMNKYGQRLFSMDFFTNGSKADLKSWMKPINILSSEWINSVNDIFIGRDILTIHNEMHSVLFLHGDLLKFGSSSRVTVFTPNKQPQSVFTSVYWGIRIMEDIDNKNICRTECTVQTGFIFKNDVQVTIIISLFLMKIYKV